MSMMNWSARALAIGLGVALLLVGCGREHPREGSVADTLANGLPCRLACPLEPWLASWRRELPGLGLDSLVRGGEQRYAPYFAGKGAGWPDSSIRTRAGIIVVSPDSMRALDVDMYMDFDVGPGGRVLVMHEPDSTPLLFDFARDTVWHVEFCGTCCGYEAACWLDSTRFALAGGTEGGAVGDAPWRAFVDVYDLRARRCWRWVSRPVPREAFGRHTEFSDSLLGVRLVRAGFTAGDDHAGAHGAGMEE